MGTWKLQVKTLEDFTHDARALEILTIPIAIYYIATERVKKLVY
jgi:hypothetical protein